jgi:hypothetical protein
MSTPTKEQSSVEADDARVGYQVAAGFSTFYSEMVWAIFNTMIVANSIVVAGISLVMTNQPSLVVLKVFLPIVGLVLCGAWFLMAKRAHEYAAYYLLSARELEEHYLSQQVKTLSRGGIFSNGGTVSLEISDGKTTRRMSLWARLLRGQWASYIVILVFLALYISILFQV